MLKRGDIVRLCVLAGSVCAALYLGFFAFEGEDAVAFVKVRGYWIMLFTFGLLVIHLGLRLVRFLRGGGIRRIPWPAVFFLLGFSVVVSLLEEDGYKVVMDEPVLATTSLQMHQEREAITVARAFELDEHFLLLDAYVDKRPHFFPFLLSVMHDLSGYRGLQGVVLNWLLTPMLFWLLYLVVRRLTKDEWPALSAPVLFATVPLLIINLSGAGFEVLNLVMILAVYLAARDYAERPDTLRLNSLLLLAVLLAQTRYESVLYVLPVAGTVALVWWRERRPHVSAVMCLVPLLLIIFPIQQGVFKTNPELWQLKGDADVPFSLAFIPQNLGYALQYFFDPGVEFPNSFLLSCLFAGSVLLLPLLFWRLRKPAGHWASKHCVDLMFGAALFATFGLLMAYHWGQLTDIIATRIALPFMLLQSIAVVLTIGFRFQRRFVRVGVFAALLIYFLAVTVPSMQRGDFLRRATEQSACNQLRAWVREAAPEQPLFVTNKQLVAIAEKASGIPLFNADRRKAEIDLHHRLGTFDEIYFVYSPDRVGSEVPIETELREHFELSVLREADIGLGRVLRLSRLDRVKFGSDESPLPLPEKVPEKITTPEGVLFYGNTLP